MNIKIFLKTDTSSKSPQLWFLTISLILFLIVKAYNMILS